MRDIKLTAVEERPYLLIFLGAVGLAGTIAMGGAVTVASIIVPGHDWISETISDLAAGPLEIITDVALYGLSVALVAVAMAASHAHLGGIFWSVGTVSMALLSGVVAIIGARNEYGDSDRGGVTVHTELVYGLGVLFFVAMLGMAGGAARHNPKLKPTFLTLAVLWGALAPVFFFLPTSIDGLYERGLGLIAGSFVICLSWMFLRRGISALGAGSPTHSSTVRLPRSAPRG